MTPIEAIREEYHLHPREESFDSYLTWHLEHGFVFSTPDYFIMGRATKILVGLDDFNRAQIDGFVTPEQGYDNCWYVHAMAGDLAKVWEILPWPLEYIAFERQRPWDCKRDLSIIPLERMKRLSHAIPKQTVA